MGKNNDPAIGMVLTAERTGARFARLFRYHPPMISYEEAIPRIAGALPPPIAAMETVALDDALGRVLAESIDMDADMPPFRRATMDGFAIRSEDRIVGATLDVVERVTAGEPVGRSIGVGRAMRVMTGAPVPEDADDVLPIEWTDASSTRGQVGGVVRIERLPRDGANIVERGSFYRAGTRVVERGTRLGAAHMGVLATVGRASVQVVARPRVSILPTGNELVPVDRPLTPGKIRNSNAHALDAQVRREGGRAVRHAPVGDDYDRLGEAIQLGLRSDLFLLSGGVSKGDLDLVPGALERAGVRCLFHGWSLQPGGPLWCGVTPDTLVLGLPGNPAATFVGFELLAVPALRHFLGRGFAPRATIRCAHRLGDIDATRRTRVRPVRLAAHEARGLEALPLAWHGSGDPMALASADGMAVLPQNSPLGDAVDVIVLGDDPLSRVGSPV